MLGMISFKEQEYLQKFARDEYLQKGEIVDLGCWLGSSTIELAKGLKDNLNIESKSGIIHAYDIFLWETWMNSLGCVVDTPLEGKYKHNDSFFEECLERTRPWHEQIQFYPGDLNEIKWDGKPIEFLFIDAMKSWDLANSILQNFFPSLIPGYSVIVHQDFNHYYTYWIHLITYRFKEYFEPIYDIPNSGSLVFKYQKAIPDDLLKDSYALASFTKDEIDAAFNYCVNVVSPEKRLMILAAKMKACLDWYQKGTNEQIEGIFLELSQEQLSLQNSVLELKRLQDIGTLKIADVYAKLQESEECWQLHTQVEVELELEQAKSRITAMESSKFWQLRSAWFKLKKKIGLPIDD